MTKRLPPYADPAYAAALLAGRPEGHSVMRVAAWEGAGILLRPIGGTGFVDAAGPYPLLPFGREWDVAAGLREVAEAGAISFVAVADALAPCTTPHHFQLQRPYKRHHLILGAPGDYRPSSHHARQIRRAGAFANLAEVPLQDHLAEWSRLYGQLAARRGFAGALQDFPQQTIEALDALDARAFAAVAGGRFLAMSLWLRHDTRAWYHLGASDAQGRATGANHALMDFAIRTLMSEGVTEVILGGGLAAIGEGDCGLDRFKSGFANASATTMLLGAVLDAAACEKLGGATGGDFFPAYRAMARQAA
jgi:hypothetical protein